MITMSTLTLLSKSKRYESSSRRSASKSVIMSPMYSQTNVPFGISFKGRTPQPLPLVRNTCNRTLQFLIK